jgi:hypothetical protein
MTTSAQGRTARGRGLGWIASGDRGFAFGEWVVVPLALHPEQWGVFRRGVQVRRHGEYEGDLRLKSAQHAMRWVERCIARPRRLFR